MNQQEFDEAARDGEMISREFGGDRFDLFRVPSGSTVKPDENGTTFYVWVPDGTRFTINLSRDFWESAAKWRRPNGAGRWAFLSIK